MPCKACINPNQNAAEKSPIIFCLLFCETLRAKLWLEPTQTINLFPVHFQIHEKSQSGELVCFRVILCTAENRSLMVMINCKA